MKIRLALALAAFTVFATGCGSEPAPAGVAREVGPIPAPQDEVVLTIAGAIGQPNVGDEVQADLAGIESLGAFDVTIFEPFISEEVAFTVVSLEDVLAAAGIDAATPLAWTALDQYQVHYSLADLAGQGGVLAIRQDGEPIGIADGGPVRVLFTEPDGELGQNTNEWIWSLARVDAG